MAIARPLITALFALLLAACGAQASVANPTPSPKPTPTPIAVYADEYIAIAAPFNVKLDALNKKYPGLNGAADYKAYYSALITMDREFAQSLQQVTFSTAVQPDARDLIKAVEAGIAVEVGCSQATTFADGVTCSSSMTTTGNANSAASNVLRLDLGLPPIS